jgi:alcohol dehydrogenase, propanol-preferring
MRAMILREQGKALERAEIGDPAPAVGEILIAVRACGVCRTDLHIVDGELTEPSLPLVPGHQVVGEIVAAGDDTERFEVGARVGVPWLAWACGECGYCRSGRENLCDRAAFTGYDRDGGFAELVTADERFALPLPPEPDDVHMAPLLCAGLIGYRALRACGDSARVGLYGFGASAHIVCQVAAHEGRRVFAFTRAGDEDGQAFARELGAEWAGDSEAGPPESLDAAIIFAPVGALVPAALRAVARGGTVVCAGIHMSEIPAFPYEVLWGERTLRSVANLTRADGMELMRIAPEVPVRTEVATYALEEANAALGDIRTGRLRGAAVLSIQGGTGG